ncbi:MAG: YebC/PmpR family DNA-binding transcriptional regulator [Deltaproteobacteria bacterium]|nr:YebC/PmpR family DNA-binding transcriptional regulator [Deltaproteobacteria bacterium]MBI3296186.1 YebC/PmpR family DNA-binding transcriptional regulator [Deltaproteobacteria bacterium]
MSGHNKWSKVKNIKGPADAKRGKLFTKITKEIIVASRTGGAHPEGNARLRTAIAAARSASMPKDNIERAIKKGSGTLDGEMIEEALYEGYGPGGVAILVETTTDNKNRTVSDLRSLFKNHGGHMAEGGSVGWMFSQCGQLVFEREKYSEDKVMEVALESAADDVSAGHDAVEVTTSVPEVYRVREAFERVGMHPLSAGLGYVAKNTVPIESKETGEKLMELLHAIEDHDDVQKVHTNFTMDDQLFSQLTAK